MTVRQQQQRPQQQRVRRRGARLASPASAVPLHRPIARSRRPSPPPAATSTAVAAAAAITPQFQRTTRQASLLVGCRGEHHGAAAPPRV